MTTETESVTRPLEQVAPPSKVRISWQWLLLLAVSLVNVWPVLWFRYLPLMDHPSHLLQYQVLSQLYRDASSFQNFYAANLLPAPNILNDYLTALLAQVFEIDLASRFTIAAAMVLLPLSVWFYLSRVHPGAQAWAFFVIPLTWSRFLAFGNENFTLAIPLLFFFLGIIGSKIGPLTKWGFAGILLLSTAIYFAHFLIFAVAGLGMTLHWLLEKKSIRSLLEHLVPMVPGSLFFLIWSANKGATANSGPISPGGFNWVEKLGAFLSGPCPFPWTGIEQTIPWLCLSLSLVIFMGVGGVVLYRKGSRFPVLLTYACAGIAVALRPWTIIYIPDQRMWYLSILLGLALLPKVGQAGFLRICIFALPLAIGSSIKVGGAFAQPNQELAAIENAFAQFPTNLRLMYFGDPALPPHLHRCFEYYHVRKGGRSTMQFVGNEHSVRYAKGQFLTPSGEAFSIYNYTADAWLPYLDHFDGVLIIGQPGPASEAIIAQLERHLFRPVSTGAITLLLSPNWKPEPAD